jgi:hypothetical protein
MFEFEFQNTDEENEQAVPVADPTALTQEEVAALIRLAESYSVSGRELIKLLVRARNLKKRNYAKRKAGVGS